MTPKQAGELKELLDSLKKSVDMLRKVHQSNHDFTLDKIDDLVSRVDMFIQDVKNDV